MAALYGVCCVNAAKCTLCDVILLVLHEFSFAWASSIQTVIYMSYNRGL